MKLAELCTAFPETAGTNDIRHPASAVPPLLRLKLRAQRGHLQAALDTHPQRSPNRLGLGLRPYESGDSLRALSSRHLLLQEQLLTRTDVSPGRFHVSVIVHSYQNMNFKSAADKPSKNQLAWATAGLIQNLHEQQAQKVDILMLAGADLGPQLIKHAARIKRSHFCYLVTDLFHNPESRQASVVDICAALSLLHLRQGMIIIVRDPLESPHHTDASAPDILTFEPPVPSGPTQTTFNDTHSGSDYIRNLENQLSDLQQQLNSFGWSSLLTTADDELDDLIRELSVRLAGQRMSQ